MGAFRRLLVLIAICAGGALAGYLVWAVQSGAVLSVLSSSARAGKQDVPHANPDPESPPPAGGGARLRLAVFYPGPVDPVQASQPIFVQMMSELIRGFDLVAVHGFRAPGRGPFASFVESVTSAAPNVHCLVYAPIREPAVRQFPMVFYNSRRLLLDRRRSGPVEDRERVFRWTPLVLSFAAAEAELSRAFTFTAIVARVDPLRVEQELTLLAELARTVAYQHAPEDDILILAHLEADEETVHRCFPNYVATVTGVPNSAGGTRLATNILCDPVATCEFTGRSGVVSLEELIGPSNRGAWPAVHFLPVWAEFTPTESPLDRLTGLVSGERLF